MPLQARQKDIVLIFANQGESAATAGRYLQEERVNLYLVLPDRELMLIRETDPRATDHGFPERSRLARVSL